MEVQAGKFIPKLEQKEEDLLVAWKLKTMVKTAMVAMISAESVYAILYFTLFNTFGDTSPINWLQVDHFFLIAAMIYLIYEDNIERGNKLLAVLAVILFFLDGVFLFAVRYVEWRAVSAGNHHKEKVKLMMMIFQILYWVDDFIVLIIALVVSYEVANLSVRTVYFNITALQEKFLKLAFALQISFYEEYLEFTKKLYAADVLQDIIEDVVPPGTSLADIQIGPPAILYQQTQSSSQYQPPAQPRRLYTQSNLINT